MNRWLARRRWILLGLTSGVLGLRIIMGLAFATSMGEAVDVPVRVAVTVLCNIALCVAAVGTIVAFVQYGRIYNARIPTE